MTTGAVFTLLEADDGNELVRLAKAKQHCPDLIITDNDMPNKDGLMAIFEIRKFSKVPIAMMTALPNGLEEIAEELGFRLLGKRSSNFDQELADWVEHHLA